MRQRVNVLVSTGLSVEIGQVDPGASSPVRADSSAGIGLRMVCRVGGRTARCVTQNLAWSAPGVSSRTGLRRRVALARSAGTPARKVTSSRGAPQTTGPVSRELRRAARECRTDRDSRSHVPDRRAGRLKTVSSARARLARESRRRCAVRRRVLVRRPGSEYAWLECRGDR